MFKKVNSNIKALKKWTGQDFLQCAIGIGTLSLPDITA